MGGWWDGMGRAHEREREGERPDGNEKDLCTPVRTTCFPFSPNPLRCSSRSVCVKLPGYDFVMVCSPDLGFNSANSSARGAE